MTLEIFLLLGIPLQGLLFIY